MSEIKSGCITLENPFHLVTVSDNAHVIMFKDKPFVTSTFDKKDIEEYTKSLNMAYHLGFADCGNVLLETFDS